MGHRARPPGKLFSCPSSVLERPARDGGIHRTLDIEWTGIYAKSDKACKFVNMEIPKRSAMQIFGASNYARNERAI
jgi:hypothetical protein